MPTTETDSDSGKGTMTSYGSVNSLNTNDSSQSASTPMDNPEQFETQKQQKEIMETGINMWVMKLYLLKRVSVKFRISIRTAVNSQYILEIVWNCHFCGQWCLICLHFQEAFFKTTNNWKIILLVLVVVCAL